MHLSSALTRFTFGQRPNARDRESNDGCKDTDGCYQKYPKEDKFPVTEGPASLLATITLDLLSRCRVVVELWR